MKQWQHTFLKYLRYEHIVVVLRCLPSKEAVGLAILKKKSEGRSRPMGPGPTSPSDFFLEIANSTAFSPQILTNTMTPCAQLEYLREIRRHSIKKSV